MQEIILQTSPSLIILANMLGIFTPLRLNKLKSCIGYAPPVDFGPKILPKVSDTYCDYFNLHIFTNLDKALKLEKKYELLDPKLLLQDFEYSTYGPVGIWSILQREYGDCVIHNMSTTIYP